MSLSRSGRAVAVALALAVASSGCAARWAYRQGQSEAKKGNWDLAVARLTRAAQRDPDNIGYKMALETARVQAGRAHYKEAKKRLAAGELDQAADELQIASRFDPSNRSSIDDLAIVRQKILKREEERQRLGDFEATKARAQAVRIPVPVLSARSPVPITLKFTDTSLQKIFETLGKLAGVNLLFDPDFRDKRYTVSMANVTFQEALEQLTLVQHLFYKVLDQNTLIVVPESPQKRRSYDDQLVRTFYLQNADVNETVTMVRNITGITKTVGNVSLGAITVVGTPDELALAEKVVENNDKAKGEVVVEVEILEVNRSQLKEYGITLSNYEASTTLSPTGGDKEVDAGFLNTRAHLLSSLNLADFIVKLPSSIQLKLLESGGNAKILASPRLRAAEGKKTALKIGTEVAIPVTSFITPQSGQPNQNFGNATSFNTRNVGVNLELTPKISSSGEITLEMAAEFSSIGQLRNVAQGLTIPDILTRNISGILRVRDGETTLIGGLIQTTDTNTQGPSLLGLGSLPLLGGLLTPRKISKEETEVLISITPHIVRAPKVTEEDMKPLYVGVKDAVRVPGARPLFGPAEPTPSPAPAAGTNPSPAPQPSARPMPIATPAATPAPTPAMTPPPVPSAAPTPALTEDLAPVVPPEATPAATPAPTPEPTPYPLPEPDRPLQARFVPPGANVRAGELATLTIVLVNARDAQSVDLVLSYDSAVIEALEIAPGALLSLDGAQVAIERQIELGKVRAKFTRGAPLSGSGAVASLTVRALKAGLAMVQVDSLAVQTPSGTRSVGAMLPGRVVVVP